MAPSLNEERSRATILNLCRNFNSRPYGLPLDRRRLSDHSQEQVKALSLYKQIYGPIAKRLWNGDQTSLIFIRFRQYGGNH